MIRTLMIRPLMIRPLMIRAFMIRQFMIRPLMIRPLMIRPFKIRPFKIRPLIIWSFLNKPLVINPGVMSQVVIRLFDGVAFDRLRQDSSEMGSECFEIGNQRRLMRIGGQYICQKNWGGRRE
jgi:hypothetical protein